MQLIVAEKHSVGSTIAKVVGACSKHDGYIEGNGYIVTWCVGHLVKLSFPEKYDEKYKKWKFETLPIIPEQWKFELDISKSKQFKIVKGLMNDSKIDEIICATDAGREGECIFRYVYNYSHCSKPVKRLWISSMEDTAIYEGMNNLQPDKNYDNLFSAGLSRNKADWLVGMNGSRLFSIRYGIPLNIGRVQTPVLAMIVKRDYDVQHFVKQKFYTVELNCVGFTASSLRIDNENEAKNLAEKCNGKNAVVSDVKKEIKTLNPPKLYDLTTLQREANRQYGYTAKQTLEYTQSLYEAKLVTYPRTDSQYLTEDMQQTATNMIQTIIQSITEFDIQTIATPNVKRCLNNSKVSDHTAIIPTAEIANIDLNGLPSGEKNILLLIAAKLLIATAETHKYEAVKAEVTSVNSDSNIFYASGKTVLENGFKELEKYIKNKLKGGDNDTTERETALPELAVGQEFKNVPAEMTEHFTSPPKSYTEDTLLKAMETAGNDEYEENADIEKKGLGTPATRAEIIENLVKREYVQRDKKKITATDKGVKLVSVVPNEVKSAKLTADWETKLQDMEKGKVLEDSFMNEIQNFVSDLVYKYGSVVENSGFGNGKEVIGICPRCGKNVYESKLSYCCESGKDGCGFTIWKNNKYPQAEITKATAKRFLANGKSELNTVNKNGEPYTGTFEMKDDGKYVNFIYCKFEKVVIGKCPICGKNIYDSPKSYSCEDKECGFVIWKSINGKNITAVQAQKLLLKRQTDLIKGFKRKTGDETFEAYLILKPDNSIGFAFPKK